MVINYDCGCTAKSSGAMAASWASLIPKHACALRVTVLGLCVHVHVRGCVTTFSATVSNKAPQGRYERLQHNMGKSLKMAFF